MKNKVGRPRIDDDKKQKYAKLAVYPRTKQRIKKNAERKNKTIVDYIDCLVDKEK